VVLTAAERRLAVVLRIFGLGLLLAAAGYYVGGAVKSDAFRELPFVANSTVKVAVLGLACIYAAGNVPRRHGLIACVIAAHVVSVATMGVMLAAADTDRILNLPVLGATEAGSVLIGAIGLDGAITLIVAVMWLLARRSRTPDPPDAEPLSVPPAQLTPPERQLRTIALVVAGLYAVGGIAYALGPLLHATDQAFVELPYVTNSTVKVAALALLCVYATRDMRRNMALLGVVVFAHALSVLAQFGYLFLDAADRRLPVGDGSVAMSEWLWGGIAHEALVGAVLFWALRRAWRARNELEFLWPLSYRGLNSAADVLVAGQHEQITAHDIAQRMEGYMRRMRAHRRWLYKGALAATELRPLAVCRPPLSEIAPPERRAYLERLFARPLFPLLRNETKAGVRICQQLTYAGYYGDERTFASTGYTPFRDRENGQPVPDRPHPLKVEHPADAETEICIVGSGAGGSILAYELAKAGHDVLVLERGEYVEPRHFTDDEVEMIGRLYADGVMQQTEDFRFTILQGGCVGGSTTVNNAVSFRPPAPVVERWNRHGAGIDLGALEASVRAVESFLRIVPQDYAPLNPSAPMFVRGAEALGLVPDRLEVKAVRANIDGCLGSGYCNIGCAWGKKLSMLETALPWGQQRYPGRVRVMADCEVRLIRARSGRPRHVVDLRAWDGAGHKFTIKADKVVLSAGAVGSSYTMLRSGVGRGLPVGRGLCFNMGSPMTAECEEVVNAFDGLQISHYGLPLDDTGYAYETWFNPPVAQAVNMPGWFEDHFENMSMYNRLMAVGVIVGTESNARVTKALLGGPGVKYTPAPGDRATIARALRRLAEILFAGGAKRVMLNTWGYEQFHSVGELDRLEEVALRPDYLALGTGHPQGGNAMSADPKRGVVDPHFRVHGYDNLYVCDASVFPTSLTVNPQLTTMGLAHYAAERVGA
jgi:choline dehydrogenase-like flavoprotein